MKQFNIKYYSTYTNIIAGITECNIRILNNIIYKHFTAIGLWD